jgi:ribose transport system ATP-binding protein
MADSAPAATAAAPAGSTTSTTSDAASGGPALRMTGMSIDFGGPLVLDGVDFEVRPGTVHALMGANGAGKSTLVKILSGIYKPSSADEMSLWGTPIEHPMVPESLGLGVVHQELPFVATMSVLENLAAGAHFDRQRGSIVHWKQERREVAALLQEYGLDVKPDQLLGTLSQAERAQVGVLRVLRAMREWGHDKWVVVLDEPTASLPGDDVQRILTWMRSLADAGGAVVFISHRIGEVLQVCDEVTVLRNGRVAWTGARADTSRVHLIDAMMGDAVAAVAAVEAAREEATIQTTGAPRLELRDLTSTGVGPVSLSVRAGEVIGVTGLVGMGQDKLPYAIIGDASVESGQVLIDGQAIGLNPASAVRNGIAFVSGDRLAEGVWAAGTSKETLTISALHRYSRWGFLNRRAERRDAAELLREYSVRPVGPESRLADLSGGNQQKVSIARGMLTEPRIVLLMEPVQGVDIGARQEIEEVVRKAAATGTAVLIGSADYEFLAAVCDRVHVMVDGRVARSVVDTELTEDNLARICLEAAA